MPLTNEQIDELQAASRRNRMRDGGFDALCAQAREANELRELIKAKIPEVEYERKIFTSEIARLLAETKELRAKLAAAEKDTERLQKSIGKFAGIVLSQIIDECEHEPWLLDALLPELEKVRDYIDAAIAAGGECDR